MQILEQLRTLQIQIGDIVRYETAVNAFSKQFSITLYYRGTNRKTLATQINYSNFEDLDRNSKSLYNSMQTHIINQRSKNES